MIYGSIPLNSNHIDISQTKRGRNPNIGFLSLFSVVVSVTIDDGSFKGIRIDDYDLFSLLPGIVSGICCATPRLTIVYRNQYIAVVYHVAISGVIASSPVRITHLYNAI